LADQVGPETLVSSVRNLYWNKVPPQEVLMLEAPVALREAVYLEIQVQEVWAVPVMETLVLAVKPISAMVQVVLLMPILLHQMVEVVLEQALEFKSPGYSPLSHHQI